MRKSLFKKWLIACNLSLCMVFTVQGQRIAPNPQPLKDVIDALEKKFSVSILYREQLVQNRKVTPDTAGCNNADKALHTLLTPLGLTYKKVSPTQIIISEVPVNTDKKENTTAETQSLLRGTVRNEKNE